MNKFFGLMMLTAALMLIGGVFGAQHAAAAPPFYTNCGDRDIFPPIQGSFAIDPASGPVGTSFKISGEARPNKQIYVSWGLGADYMDVNLGSMTSDSLGNLAGEYVVPATMPWNFDEATGRNSKDITPGQYWVLLVEDPSPGDSNYFPFAECLAFEVTGSQVATDAYTVESAGVGTESGTLPETGVSYYQILILVLISGVFLFGRKYLGGG